MRELVFRDPQKGSVVLKSRQAGLSVGRTGAKFLAEGMALQGGASEEILQGFFSTYQDFDFIFIKGSSPGSPPFRFVIRGEKDHLLPITALNEGIFMARWNSQQWVGELEILLEDGSGKLLWRLQTEVVPQHLPYRKEQAYMVAELEGWMAGLSRSLEKPISAAFSHQLPWYQKDFEQDQIEGKLIHQFEKSLIFLENNLEEDWKFTHRWTLRPRGSRGKQPGLKVNNQGKRWLTHKEKSRDIPLNRWLLYCLNRLQLSLHKEKHETLKRRISLFIQRNLGELFLSGHLAIPPHLPLAYRRWYATYLPLLRRATLLSLSREKQSLKDLPQLYEYWAFLKLAAIVGELSGARLRFQDLLRFEQGQGVSRLSQGQQLHFTYELPDGQGSLDLWYQREISTPLGRHKPDIWLEIRHEHFETPFIFLMDVKFQVKPTPPGQAKDFEVPRDALNQLHRYRDALKPLLVKEAAGPLAQKAWGGSVLFPYPKEASEFASHPQYQQLWEEGIGAIPLYPSPYSNQDLLYQWLRELLEMPSEAFFERMVDYDKREQRFSMERFDIPFLIKKEANEGPGYWDEASREWVGEERTPLFGGGSLPSESRLGALDAALRYRQLHLLWLRDYGELRLWQEALKRDGEAHWSEKGLHVRIKGVHCRIQTGDRVRVHFLGNVLRMDLKIGASEIFNRIKKAL